MRGNDSMLRKRAQSRFRGGTPLKSLKIDGCKEIGKIKDNFEEHSWIVQNYSD